MSYYNLLSIKSENFMSFRDCEFSLSDLGVVLVDGKNKFEPKADSNGSGKSALFEMIIWLLTGYTSRGSSNVANSIINNGVYVKGEMYIDNDHYVITRAKNHPEYGSGIFIVKNGEDISGDTLTKSKDILNQELNGLDYDTLTSIIVLSQGLPSRLSSLKPSSRKSRLEELSNTDYYVSEVKAKIDAAISELSSKQSQLSSKIMALDTEINSCNFNISNSQRKINEIESNSGSIIDEETAKSYASLLNDLDAELVEASNQNMDMIIARNNYSSEIATLNSKVESLKLELTKLMNDYNNIQSATCPLCKQAITSEEELANMRNSISSRILEIKKELGEIINSRLPLAINEVNRLNSEITISTENINSIKSEMAVYNEELNKYKSYSSSTDILKETINSNMSKIQECDKEKKIINNELADIIELISIANFYKNQVSRKFRSFLLTGVINYMNKKSEEYSKYLFDKQGVVKLVADGNNLDIYLGDTKFEDLSGGEGRRVDIILQIIQRDLARNQSGLSSNILVLDEILDYLDASGIESTIKLIESKSPDVESMLVVSHKKDIKIPSDSMFTVIKYEDRISKLRFNGYANA